MDRRIENRRVDRAVGQGAFALEIHNRFDFRTHDETEWQMILKAKDSTRSAPCSFGVAMAAPDMAPTGMSPEINAGRTRLLSRYKTSVSSPFLSKSFPSFVTQISA